MMPKRGAATYVVNTSDEFDRWWAACSEALQDAIAAHVGLLERIGPQLGRPYADTLGGSTISSLEELRVQHRGQPRIGPYTRSTFGVRRCSCWLGSRATTSAGVGARFAS